MSRSYAQQTREQLLRFWEAESDFGRAIGCVATTFTFDGGFFEEECLARFAGLESDPREDGAVYLVEREEKLAELFACVLVDDAHVAPLRSLRWHLLPVRFPGPGVMHAKVTLLAWEHRVRVLVGSANVTEPGYRRNYEHMAVLEFTPEGNIPLALLYEVVDFLDRLRAFAPGFDNHNTPGPQVELAGFLSRVRMQTSSWDDPETGRRQPSASFVPVWPTGRSLFAQLKPLFPANAGATDAWVLSPFYDDANRGKRVVAGLLDSMAARGERRVHFLASAELPATPVGEKSIVELCLPDALREPAQSRCEHKFNRVVPTDSEDSRHPDETRTLHAKSLWLQRGEQALYVVGSSNFTIAGTGVDAFYSNIEANLAYVLPAAGHPFARMCDSAYPPFIGVDLETQDVRFMQTLERTDGGDGPVSLPMAFGQALFRPEGETGVLELTVLDRPSEDCQVMSPPEVDAGSVCILNPIQLDASRYPSIHQVPWAHSRPPSHLLVEWRRESERCEAIWVVNVTDTALLPPPDELRNLPLEELLLILSSARPLHEAIRLMLRKRGSGEGSGRNTEVEGDPHRRVDTSGFLLRRMRRVAGGLEGLRERLERPVWNLDGLRWRLHGPVGPLALADRLVESEPTAAQFMLAEVALTIHRANWTRVAACLGHDLVQDEMRQVIDELRDRAQGLVGPSNLGNYVEAAFAEIDQ